MQCWGNIDEALCSQSTWWELSQRAIMRSISFSPFLHLEEVSVSPQRIFLPRWAGLPALSLSAWARQRPKCQVAERRWNEQKIVKTSEDQNKTSRDHGKTKLMILRMSSLPSREGELMNEWHFFHSFSSGNQFSLHQ